MCDFIDRRDMYNLIDEKIFLIPSYDLCYIFEDKLVSFHMSKLIPVILLTLIVNYPNILEFDERIRIKSLLASKEYVEFIILNF